MHEGSSTDEPTIFNTVVLMGGPFGSALHACRLCGALVTVDPPDYADQHVKWHERHDRKDAT